VKDPFFGKGAPSFAPATLSDQESEQVVGGAAENVFYDSFGDVVKTTGSAAHGNNNGADDVHYHYPQHRD
jgi:hypothetical protein